MNFKVGDKFRKWQKISTGVPQVSILGPLFFNSFINNLFLFIETTALCNYADGSIMQYSDKNSNNVISRPRHDFAIISEWFYENYMVFNPDKCHFLTLGFYKAFPDFSFKNTIIKNITEEKILETAIENNLNFKSHITKYVLNPTKDFVHLQNFKINNPYSEEKTDKFFYQCSIYLLSFDHKSRRGRKSHLKKQSHRKSLLPPEITLLKSRKNFQSQA